MPNILIAVQASSALSVAASAAGDTSPLAADTLDFPSWVVRDLSYRPIPIGQVGDLEQSVSSLAAEQSQNFVVRAFVEDGQVENLGEHFDLNTVFSDPQVAALPVCGGDSALGDQSDVYAKLDLRALHQHGLNGSKSAVAIMDSGINGAHLTARLPSVNIDQSVCWRASGTGPPPGKHAVDHGTMCAFNVLHVAPKATLLDYPILTSSPPSAHMLSGALSNALSAYAHLLSWWAVAFGPSRSNYNSLVVSNSWGVYDASWDFPAGHPGRYIDNPSHPFNQIVGVLAGGNVDIVYAAGNCGGYCPSAGCGSTTHSIMGANAHPNVISVGGVDTQDNWVGYSSKGPSIPGMDPEKPDFAAYTHFKGSEAYGPGSADGGTSTACPVAAGCVAALRTRIAQTAVSPAQMSAQLEFHARNPGAAAGWNSQLGHGIIDPVAVARNYGKVP